MSDIPMSLRTTEGEKEYQRMKENGMLIPLQDEPSIHEFRHWVVKANRFPYDVAYDKHDLLIPRANVSQRHLIPQGALDELEHILEYYVYPNYDLWFENTPRRRSVPWLYHLHLARYHKDRELMQL